MGPLTGALQFLGNLFEYFLTRRNKGKVGKGMFMLDYLQTRDTGVPALTLRLDRHHLTVVGATSGDVS